MNILGIDPGTERLGWSCVNYNHNHVESVNYGCLESRYANTEERLLTIHSKLLDIIVNEKPDVASVEEIFFATNAKTVIQVSQARGVVLLSCALKNLPVVSYSPLAIKRAITGDGNADKQQVQYMVAKILRLAKPPKPDDAADAIAIALTHAYSNKLKSKIL